MKAILFLTALLFATEAFAGFQGFNQALSGTTMPVTDLKLFSAIQCSTGISCTRAGGKLVMKPQSIGLNHFSGWKPPTLTSGTSTTPSATTVYLNQVFIPSYTTLTGIKVNNGATVGTNKYIVALFDFGGRLVASSALAGVTTAGADSYQTIPFTAPVAVAGPHVYWIGLYVNGVTDRFRSVPAVGEIAGYTGTITGQTFGTIVSVTPPTSFTADVGPVAFTY